MDLRHLRYFVAVAEERHFGRAAQRLHMAQPPLSQAIRQLEGELGVQLLTRTTRRVDITDAGAAYLERARGVLADVDAAAHEAQRVAAGRAGRVAIGCVGSATYSLLPPLARALREELPGIDFTFRGEMLVPAQLAALRDGSLDVALLRPPADAAGVSLRRLRTDALVVALPDGHRLADDADVRLADLAGDDFIVHAGEGRSVMHAEVVRRCRSAGFEPRIRHEVAETSTLVTFVAAGLGVALVPEPVSRLVVAGACHRPLVDPGPGVDLVVATREQPSAGVTSVLAVLDRVVAAP